MTCFDRNHKLYFHTTVHLLRTRQWFPSPHFFYDLLRSNIYRTVHRRLLKFITCKYANGLGIVPRRSSVVVASFPYAAWPDLYHSPRSCRAVWSKSPLVGFFSSLPHFLIFRFSLCFRAASISLPRRPWAIQIEIFVLKNLWPRDQTAALALSVVSRSQVSCPSLVWVLLRNQILHLSLPSCFYKICVC